MKPRKRLSILEAAETLFNRFGLTKTGIDEIAASARVARGTIYNYFGSKEGVIRELLRHKMESFDLIMKTCIAQGSDPIEKLRLLMKKRMSFIVRNPLLADYVRSPQGGKDIGELYGEINRKAKDAVLEIIRQAQGNGNISVTNAERMASVLVKALKGFEKDHVESQGIIEDSTETMESDLDYFVSLIIKGVKGGA
jgi:AcrR family transcriptional regulator